MMNYGSQKNLDQDFGSESDRSLWNKLLEGDLHAFDLIYETHIRLLYDYGRKLTRDEGVVVDCIQDMFLEIWTKRDRLTSTNHIKPYLFKSLKRKIIRKLEREKRFLYLGQFTSSHPFQLEYSPEQAIIRQDYDLEQIKKLNRSLGKLTVKQREVIYLKYYQQLSFSEVAEVLEVKTKAVYKLLDRAIIRLRESFYLIPIFLMRGIG